MPEIIGTVVDLLAKASQDGKKTWQNVVVEDTIGMQHTIGHWGKPLVEENVKGKQFKVDYTQNGQYMNLKGLVPTTITEQKNLAQTEPAEAQKRPSPAPQSPQQSSTPAQRGYIAVSPQYLAMKLAVEMVRAEGIEIDKKEARLRQYYELILGEFNNIK